MRRCYSFHAPAIAGNGAHCGLHRPCIAALYSRRRTPHHPSWSATAALPAPGLLDPNVQPQERDERIGKAELPATPAGHQRHRRERTDSRDCLTTLHPFAPAQLLCLPAARSSLRIILLALRRTSASASSCNSPSPVSDWFNWTLQRTSAARLSAAARTVAAPDFMGSHARSSPISRSRTGPAAGILCASVFAC